MATRLEGKKNSILDFILEMNHGIAWEILNVPGDEESGNSGVEGNSDNNWAKSAGK